MYRIGTLLLPLVTLNCTVVTSILSSDVGDAAVASSDAAVGVADAAKSDGGPVPIDDAGNVLPKACPVNYTPVANTCHRVSEGQLTWLNAELDCESDGDGAHLVVVSDMAEHAALPANVWIGVYEYDLSANVTTVTNMTPPFTNWADGEPVAGPSFCVESRPDGWHDDNCLEEKSYVCECDGMPAVSPIFP